MPSSKVYNRGGFCLKACYTKLNFKIVPELIDVNIIKKLKIDYKMIYTLYTEINKEIRNLTEL